MNIYIFIYIDYSVFKKGVTDFFPTSRTNDSKQSHVSRESQFGHVCCVTLNDTMTDELKMTIKGRGHDNLSSCLGVTSRIQTHSLGVFMTLHKLTPVKTFRH
jgi:hypothetical protein